MLGSDSDLPKFIGSAMPTACMVSEAKTGLSCYADRAATIAAVKNVCLGQFQCNVNVVDVVNRVRGAGGDTATACPKGSKQRLRVVAKCVDQSNMIAHLDAHKGCCGTYESRPARLPPNLPRFFDARAAYSNALGAMVSQQKLGIANVSLIAAEEGAGATVHRMMMTSRFTEFSEHGSAASPDLWGFRVSGLAAVASGKLGVLKQPRGPGDEWLEDACDEIGGCDLGACKRPRGDGTCVFNLHLEAGREYRFELVFSTPEGADVEGALVVLEYHLPPHCTVNDCDVELTEEAVDGQDCTLLSGEDVPWMTINAVYALVAKKISSITRRGTMFRSPIIALDVIADSWMMGKVLTLTDELIFNGYEEFEDSHEPTNADDDADVGNQNRMIALDEMTKSWTGLSDTVDTYIDNKVGYRVASAIVLSDIEAEDPPAIDPMWD